MGIVISHADSIVFRLGINDEIAADSNTPLSVTVANLKVFFQKHAEICGNAEQIGVFIINLRFFESEPSQRIPRSCKQRHLTCLTS